MCDGCAAPFINTPPSFNAFNERCELDGTPRRRQKEWERTVRNAGTCAIIKTQLAESETAQDT